MLVVIVLFIVVIGILALTCCISNRDISRIEYQRDLDEFLDEYNKDMKNKRDNRK